MNNTALIAELAKLRSSSTFLSLVGYHNEVGEVADYSIVFHMSYENALKRSIETLEATEVTTDLEKLAKRELIESFNTSLVKMAATPIEEVDDAYTRFFEDDGTHIKGVKVHTASGALHLYGLVVHRNVRVVGVYPTRNRKALTVAKDKLRALTSVGKFRQFKIVPSTCDRIVVENLQLLP